MSSATEGEPLRSSTPCCPVTDASTRRAAPVLTALLFASTALADPPEVTRVPVNAGPSGTVAITEGGAHFVEYPGPNGVTRHALQSEGCDAGDADEWWIPADIDGDGRAELFLRQRFNTGAGMMGAVDIFEMCGWALGDKGPSRLDSALEAELRAVGASDTASIEQIARQRAKGPMVPVALTTPAVQPSSERTRRYAIGSWEVLLQQTGRYAVDVRAKSDDGAMEHITTLRTLSWQAIPTASRPWDYDDQWDPVMLEGEPACCAMDLASGRGPAVTGAWSYRGGLRLTVETPALGPNESASCTLVMLTPQGSAPADMTCEDFRALTSGAKP